MIANENHTGHVLNWHEPGRKNVSVGDTRYKKNSPVRKFAQFVFQCYLVHEQ